MIPRVEVQDDIGNAYVEGMTNHQHLDATFTGVVRLDGNAAGANGSLMAATTVASGGTITPEKPLQTDAPFGRSLNVTSTDAGAATIVGRDYLGQVMTETVTCTAGTVQTDKAFAYVDRIDSGAVDGDISIGNGTKFGVPFVIADVMAEFADGVTASAPAHVAADASEASATTNDVRGTVVPTTTPNGSKVIDLEIRFYPNATGGLYGVAQG